MIQINFTKAYLENLPNAEKDKRYMVYDTNIPQLAIRVTDNGTKSFLIQKTSNSSPVKITFGRFPEMNIIQTLGESLDVHLVDEALNRLKELRKDSDSEWVSQAPLPKPDTCKTLKKLGNVFLIEQE